ncbi:MAG: lysogenization regulator HflD [Gammaproteobacteria bacterium]|nr:MAG: lysogenization regulator HflD [Gammaproteobacteria bacterium]
MEKNLHNQTLALAGLFQAARLVQQQAREGFVEPGPKEASLESLFAFDAPGVEAVWGGLPGLRLGLETLVAQLHPADPQQAMELTRYVIGLMHLERRLHRNREAQQRLRQGLERVAEQRRYFGGINETVIAALGDLYHEVISPLGPRILVQGEQRFLAEPGQQALIRALLLAGIRAALLWRQAGGSRWRLLLQRARIQHIAEEALKVLELA